jgi:catechol 2,3-dioxygenase-like lactoylglutathione lyase family enzyme
MKPGSPPRFRVARPSRDLEMVQRFYTRALGFQVLAAFTGHHGIDGIILGHPAWPYHLEFTRRREDPIRPRPTEEDLLVFYLPEPSLWSEVVRRCHDVGASFVTSSNPYWDEHGVTLEDPDGYRIVLQQADWESSSD